MRTARGLPRQHLGTNTARLCRQVQPGRAQPQRLCSLMQQHGQPQMTQSHLPSDVQPGSARTALSHLQASPAGPQQPSTCPAAPQHHLLSLLPPGQAAAAPATASSQCPQVGNQHGLPACEPVSSLCMVPHAAARPAGSQGLQLVLINSRVLLQDLRSSRGTSSRLSLSCEVYGCAARRRNAA